MEEDAIFGSLSVSAPAAGILEGQTHLRQQMLDGAQKVANRMASSCRTQILGSNMQIDLGARNQPVSQQVPQGH
jgi:hypothetical protein